MTQTGMPPESNGSGAPKVSPLRELGPALPDVSQEVSDWPSQLLRQYFSVEPTTTGKVCDSPVDPVARSSPCSWTVNVTCFGSPADSRFGHTSTLSIGAGTQRTRRKFLPLPLADLKFILSRAGLDGLFLRFPLRIRVA